MRLRSLSKMHTNRKLNMRGIEKTQKYDIFITILFCQKNYAISLLVPKSHYYGIISTTGSKTVIY